MSGRRGLSKPVLDALFHVEGEEITLLKLQKLTSRLTLKRFPPKARHNIPPGAFFVGSSGRRRLVRALQKFVNRGIVSVSDPQLYRSMLEVRKSKFPEAWSQGKNLVIKINRFKLVDLAIAKPSVKRKALEILTTSGGISVASAIDKAREMLKKR